MSMIAPPSSTDQHSGSFEERRRTPPDTRASRESELEELARGIAERIRPAFSHLEEEDLLRMAREMARTEFRYRDGGRGGLGF
jgi:hypothetical protein